MVRRGAFWVDQEYDREHGDGPLGRYATHVHRCTDAFAPAWGDIAPVAFACTAWALASPPALAPGYVRWHRRILSAVCTRNPWDGGLTAHVRLAAPLPAALTRTRAWWRDRGWRDWPELLGQYVDPSAEDLARSPHLRACLLVDTPVPLDQLPPAPDGPEQGLAETAERAVSALARELTDLIAPIITQLESPDRVG
jgi:hypothetical protein